MNRDYAELLARGGLLKPSLDFIKRTGRPHFVDHLVFTGNPAVPFLNLHPCGAIAVILAPSIQAANWRVS